MIMFQKIKENKESIDTNEPICKNQGLKWNIIKYKDQNENTLKYKDQKCMFANNKKSTKRKKIGKKKKK